MRQQVGVGLAPAGRYDDAARMNAIGHAGFERDASVRRDHGDPRCVLDTCPLRGLAGRAGSGTPLVKVADQGAVVGQQLVADFYGRQRASTARLAQVLDCLIDLSLRHLTADQG